MQEDIMNNGGKKEKKSKATDIKLEERYIIDVPTSFIQHCYDTAQTKEHKEELSKLLKQSKKELKIK